MLLDLTVVLPTYNELGNLASAVAAIRRTGARVLVVDDDSPDGTGAEADRLAASDPAVTVLHRPVKQGLGPAYAAGFGAVLATDADLVGQLDADGSHDPADLARLTDAIASGADVAIGSRYVPGGSTEGWSLWRRALSRGANWYVRLALSVRTHDSTAGFRVYRRDALRLLDPATCRASGYAFQVEMTYRAERAGLRIDEVPVRFVERRVGASKMSVVIALEAMWLITAWGLRRVWRRLRSRC